jgi:hypothetical protein
VILAIFGGRRIKRWKSAESVRSGIQSRAYRLVVYGEVRYCEIGSDEKTPYYSRFCYLFSTENLSVIGGELILWGPRE